MPLAKAPSETTITARKSINFRYSGPAELSDLFNDFRSMCNDAIKIAIQFRPSNKFKLIELAYPTLKTYGLHTHYILSACEVAFSACKNPKKKTRPYVTSAFLKLDNQSYRLDHLLLRIPTKPRQFVFLTLHGSAHHSTLIDDPCLSKGSVTITPVSANITLSKEVPALKAVGHVGMDVNERNATVSATDGWQRQFSELGEIVEIKERFKILRTRIESATGRDRRICKRLLRRCGERERNRTLQRIHRLTKQVVEHAVTHDFDIKLERLTGIRRLFRKEARHSKSFRGRMNSWAFREVQRQVHYKANWDGVPVYFVNPAGTSRNCPDCGSRVAQLAYRKLYCPKCDRTWDRDVLASRNIMACVVPQARPSMGSREGERGDDGSNPLSRWREGETTD